MTGRVYIGKVMTQFGLNPSRNERDIRQASECTKREFEKYFLGSRTPTKKCAMKMKQTNKKKKTTCVKMLLMEGGFYRVHTKNRRRRFGQASGQRFLRQ